MTTVLTLNLDGSFQEIQPLAVSQGAASADQLVRLNSYGQFDSSVIPPIPVSLLLVNGTPSITTYLRGDGSWSIISEGFINPMTSAGDLIVGGISGAATRLGIGTSGQVLSTSLSGQPVWTNLLSPSYSQTIGDGVNSSIVVNHNLGTKDITVSVFETTGNCRKVVVDTQNTTVNSVTLVFTYPPTTNAYRVNIFAGTGYTVNIGNISASGTANNTTYLRGDGTWNTPTVFGNMAVSGNITAIGTNQTIGTVLNPFAAIYAGELYLSTHTLYLGGVPVLGTNQQTIQITADPDQSINMITTGVGQSLITSVDGVQITASGLNSVVNLQSTGSGGLVSIGSTFSVNVNTPNTYINGKLTVSQDVVFNGSVTLNGQITAINTATLSIVDNIILLNSGNTGHGVADGFSGLRVDRGQLVDQRLVFIEATETWEMGPIGSEVPIANTNIFTAIASGLVPLSGGGQTNFLRADGVWAAPPTSGGSGNGGSSGSVVLYVMGSATLTTATNILLCNSPSACVITLPAGIDNTKFTIRNVGAGTVTLQPNVPNTIEFTSTFPILSTNCVDIVYYSGNWYLI